MSEDIYKTLCARLMQVNLATPLNVCCLCLNHVSEDDFSVDDEVVLSFHTGGKPVARKISDIIKLLLEESLSEVMCMLKTVCKQCLNIAVAGYKLIQNCKINFKILNETVENLEQSLSDLPADMYNCKSLYVAVNPTEISKDCVIKRYFDKQRHFIPQDTALPRFKTMLEYLYPKTSICCKTNIETEDIIYNHRKTNDYKCAICQVAFVNSTSLRIHFFKEHHHNKDVKCKECYKISDPKLLFDMHEQADINLEKATLSPEGIQFQDDTELLDFVDTPPPAVQCEVIATSDTAQIRENLGENTEDEPGYTCSNCDLTFKDLYWYNKHIEKKTNCRGARGKFCCDYCGRCYTYKHNVRAHILREHMGKGSPCECCGKRFMTSSSLKQHMKRHTKEKSAMCVECGKTFVHENYLKTHMRIHTGEKPYKCEICHKTFTHAPCYNEHVKTHKPKTKCKFCHKMFKHSSLSKHLQKSHFANISSELSHRKTYYCNICNPARLFINNYELQCHIRRHMGKEHQCNICSKKFSRKSSLNRHKQMHFDINSKLYVKNISVNNEVLEP